MASNYFYCTDGLKEALAIRNLSHLCNVTDTSQHTGSDIVELYSWFILLAILVVLVSILMALFCFRQYLKATCYNTFVSLKRRRPELNVPFDVFVVHDNRDEAVHKWVLDVLVSKLEQKYHLRVYLLSRDLQMGEPPSSSGDVVQQCKRTIVVVSPNLGEKVRAVFAMQNATHYMIQNKQHQVTAVMWERVGNYWEIKDKSGLHPSVRTLLALGKDLDRSSRSFWTMLHYRMPAPELTKPVHYTPSDGLVLVNEEV